MEEIKMKLSSKQKKLLDKTPKGDDEGEYTEEFRLGLMNAKIEFASGKILTLEEVQRKLKLANSASARPKRLVKLR